MAIQARAVGSDPFWCSSKCGLRFRRGPMKQKCLVRLDGRLSCRWSKSATDTTAVSIGGTPVRFLPLLLTIVFRESTRHRGSTGTGAAVVANRLGAYEAVMNDRYPSTDEQQTVQLDVPYPDPRHELNRRLSIVKWLVAIPHYVMLFVIYVTAFIAVIGAWFAVRFIGSYTRGTVNYVEGSIRWHNRIVGDAFTLAIDDCSPFALGP
jgi:hypothetical protein